MGNSRLLILHKNNKILDNFLVPSDIFFQVRSLMKLYIEQDIVKQFQKDFSCYSIGRCEELEKRFSNVFLFDKN